MIRLFFVGLLCCNSALAGNTYGPHTHGELEFVATPIEGGLRINLVGTAQDLIGYERAPQSAKEKKLLRKFDEKYDPLIMFQFNPQSGCQFSSGRSSSDMFSAAPHKHGFLGETHSHGEGLEGHIGFLLEYDFLCDAPADQPIELQMDIFDLATSIKTINIHRGSIDSSVVMTLQRDDNTFTISPEYLHNN